MKYIPLKAKDRTYIYEPAWNWQFIRNVQRILNVTKGSVMTGEEFFYRAFGETEEDFIEILHMPENILMHRGKSPKPKERAWKQKFRKLTRNEKKELLSLLCNKRTQKQLTDAIRLNKNRKLKKGSILPLYEKMFF